MCDHAFCHSCCVTILSTAGAEPYTCTSGQAGSTTLSGRLYSKPGVFVTDFALEVETASGLPEPTGAIETTAADKMLCSPVYSTTWS